VGDAPHAFLSTDHGASWLEVPVPGGAFLTHVSISPAGEVWTGSADGRLLRADPVDLLFEEAVALGGGPIADLEWQGSTGFVAANAGAFRSLDGGESWALMPDPGQPFEGFIDVSFRDPVTGVLYTAFAEWFTTDGGDTWTERDILTGPTYFKRAVWIGPGHRLVALDGEGADIWDTTDDGATWTRRLQLPFTGVPDLVHGPGGRLLAMSSAGDLLRSDDNGLTWVNALTRPGGQSPGRAMGMALVPGTEVVVAAIQPSGGVGAGIIRSLDGGVHWTDASLDDLSWGFTEVVFPDPTLGLAVAISGVGRVGVYVSTDQGASWEYEFVDEPDAPFRLPVDLDLAPDGTVTLFAQGSGLDPRQAVYRRLSDGTWERRDDGLPATAGGGPIAFGDADHGLLVDPGLEALYGTEDGTTWTPRSGTGIAIGDVIDLAYVSPTEVLAAVDDRLDPEQAGVYRSADGGDTWTPARIGNAVRTLTVDHPSGSVGAGGSLGPCEVSRDDGTTWETVSVPWELYSGAVLPTEDAVLIATFGSSIFGRSRDDVVSVAPPDGVTARLRATPSPFTRAVSVRVHLPEGGGPGLEVHDAIGRRIVSRQLSTRPAGPVELRWDGLDQGGQPVAPGVYWIQIRLHDRVLGTARVVRIAH
jgi:photosystem II stability/assembly factor-like uncharacterized protein